MLSIFRKVINMQHLLQSTTIVQMKHKVLKTKGSSVFHLLAFDGLDGVLPITLCFQNGSRVMTGHCCIH